MIERAPKTAREWRSEQRVIKSAGNAALQSPTDLDIESIAGAYTTNKYELMAMKRHREFLQLLGTGLNHEADGTTERKLAMSPEIEHGYLVIGRTLGYAAQAYKKFCESEWRSPDVRELASLLLADQAFGELVTPLATVPDDMNGPLEDAYGLTENSFSIGYSVDQPPIVIRQEESGELHIGFHEGLRSDAQEAIPTRDYRKAETCPAHDVLLRPLWEDMVVEAAVNPDMFATDLGLVKAA